MKINHTKVFIMYCSQCQTAQVDHGYYSEFLHLHKSCRKCLKFIGNMSRVHAVMYYQDPYMIINIHIYNYFGQDKYLCKLYINDSGIFAPTRCLLDHALDDFPDLTEVELIDAALDIGLGLNKHTRQLLTDLLIYENIDPSYHELLFNQLLDI
jgi:hypothetical protein